MTIVVQRNGIRVIGIRKSGHTSIINTFLTVRKESCQGLVDSDEPLVALNSGDLAHKLGVLRAEYGDHHDWPTPRTSIAFVRDPVHRALSAYHHFFVRDTRRVRDGKLGELGFTLEMSFDDYCLHLMDVDLSQDPHIDKQMTFLFNDELDGDEFVLCRLEWIDTAWPEIVREYNLDCSPLMEEHNVGEYNPDEYLTSQNLAILEDLYYDDRALWNALGGEEARKDVQERRNQTH